MSEKMSEAEIGRKYLEWMLPALQELEIRLEKELAEFEKTYDCRVVINLPTGEQMRYEKKHFVLGQYHSLRAHNLMRQRLGLSPEDYPPLQYF